jgi:hypothetical protein
VTRKLKFDIVCVNNLEVYEKLNSFRGYALSLDILSSINEPIKDLTSYFPHMKIIEIKLSSKFFGKDVLDKLDLRFLKRINLFIISMDDI